MNYHIRGIPLPIEYQSVTSTQTDLEEVTKYTNYFNHSFSRLHREVLMEEERLKPEIESIGEKFLNVSNEKINDNLIKLLYFEEMLALKKLHELQKLGRNRP